MLLEEAGELAKAVRKEAGMGFSATTQTKDIEEELADVQIVLLAGRCACQGSQKQQTCLEQAAVTGWCGAGRQPIRRDSLFMA